MNMTSPKIITPLVSLAALAATAAEPLQSANAVPAAVRDRVGSKADGYELVYAADVPVGTAWGSNGRVDYSFDGRGDRGFDRAAFFMELTSLDGTATNWIWVSMDKYTAGSSTRELSIPVLWDGAPGRYRLSNLDVASNVSGVSTGAHSTGVAELWDSDYYAGRGDASFGGSDGDVYDWNDWWNTANLNKPAGEYGQHGCFQFFATSDDLTTGETLFAINHWGAGFAAMDVGIGRCPSSDPAHFDWSYENNAGQYGTRRIYAFARPVSTDIPSDVTDKVGDSANGYKLLYRIDLESSMTVNNGNYGDMTVNTVTYNRIHGVNNSKALSQFAYSRVAYCLELVAKDTHATNWVWTAFDWQDDNFAKIDIPTVAGGSMAMRVANLEVKSNVGGIATGSSIATGNIEFTPYNYWTPNGNYGDDNKIPGASEDTCDFGDLFYADGHYGCMPVHNYGAAQTIWAVNTFNGGSNDNPEIGIGIGNNSSNVGFPDWTNTTTGNLYEKMTLYVMIQPMMDALVAVVAKNRRQVCVSFAGEASTPLASWFAVDGTTPSTARVSTIDSRDVILDLDAELDATVSHTVAVRIPGCAEKVIVCQPVRALPACLASVSEAQGYVLVNDLAIQAVEPWYSTKGVDYIVDESRFSNVKYDRVAYLLELKSRNQEDYRWVWVSMDKFTDDLTKIGVPTVRNDGLIQTLVANLHVEAGVTSGDLPVKTGNWADGNIEFSPFNYAADPTMNLDGGSGAFDFDDKLDRDSSGNAGYACMQVHNYRERETVFAFNHYNWDATPGVTIGNAAGVDTDGTWLANAGDFEILNLRVFVRPKNRGVVIIVH